MKTLLKLTSILLIQVFMLLDLAWAGAIGQYSKPAMEYGTLSPAVSMDNTMFQQMYAQRSKSGIEQEHIEDNSTMQLLGLERNALIKGYLKQHKGAYQELAKYPLKTINRIYEQTAQDISDVISRFSESNDFLSNLIRWEALPKPERDFFEKKLSGNLKQKILDIESVRVEQVPGSADKFSASSWLVFIESGRDIFVFRLSAVKQENDFYFATKHYFPGQLVFSQKVGRDKIRVDENVFFGKKIYAEIFILKDRNCLHEAPQSSMSNGKFTPYQAKKIDSAIDWVIGNACAEISAEQRAVLKDRLKKYILPAGKKELGAYLIPYYAFFSMVSFVFWQLFDALGSNLKNLPLINLYFDLGTLGYCLKNIKNAEKLWLRFNLPDFNVKGRIIRLLPSFKHNAVIKHDISGQDFEETIVHEIVHLLEKWGYLKNSNILASAYASYWGIEGIKGFTNFEAADFGISLVRNLPEINGDTDIACAAFAEYFQAKIAGYIKNNYGFLSRNFNRISSWFVRGLEHDPQRRKGYIYTGIALGLAEKTKDVKTVNKFLGLLAKGDKLEKAVYEILQDYEEKKQEELKKIAEITGPEHAELVDRLVKETSMERVKEILSGLRHKDEICKLCQKVIELEIKDNPDSPAQCYDLVLKWLFFQGALEGVVIYPFSGYDFAFAKYAKVNAFDRNDLLRQMYAEYVSSIMGGTLQGYYWKIIEQNTVQHSLDVLVVDNLLENVGRQGKKTLIFKNFSFYAEHANKGSEYDQKWVEENWIKRIDKELMREGDHIILFGNDDKFVPYFKKLGYEAIPLPKAWQSVKAEEIKFKENYLYLQMPKVLLRKRNAQDRATDLFIYDPAAQAQKVVFNAFFVEQAI